MSAPLRVVCPHCTAVNRVPSERLGQGPRCGQCHQPLFTRRPVELNEVGFDRQIANSDIPVVVDFWAPWCGPCLAMAPEFEKVAAMLEPNVRFAKVNTEIEQRLAARFNIMSIPTTALFHDGREVARQPGAMNATTIANWVRTHTAGQNRAA
ncbi:MAG: thioredoxin TrxC [Candidatus Manganitrophaceae bacterium]|nr:MAG: thioredoxin TrxC [Candidatus Manganitrophaceae bacterium]